MLLYSYEEDIEQVSSGSNNNNNFMVISAGINFLNLNKLGFNPCPSFHPQQKARGNSFNA